MNQQVIDGFIGVLYSLLLTDLMEATPLPPSHIHDLLTLIFPRERRGVLAFGQGQIYQ